VNKAAERSSELYSRALAVSPGGVHSPVRAFGQTGGSPLFIRSAEGSTLTDVDGNTYTDFCMAFGPLILGHNDPAVAAAAHAALDDGWSYGTAEPWSTELAELTRAGIPWAEKIRDRGRYVGIKAGPGGNRSQSHTQVRGLLSRPHGRDAD
jgi:glutamate-1-semialdehyde 2,1-aminomutase